MNYWAQAQTAWANAQDAETKLRQGRLSPGQQEFAESLVPRAKQDASILAQLAQAEALTRMADSLDTLLAALQAGRITHNGTFPANHIHFVTRKRKQDDED